MAIPEKVFSECNSKWSENLPLLLKPFWPVLVERRPYRCCQGSGSGWKASSPFSSSAGRRACRDRMFLRFVCCGAKLRFAAQDAYTWRQSLRWPRCGGARGADKPVSQPQVSRTRLARTSGARILAPRLATCLSLAGDIRCSDFTVEFYGRYQDIIQLSRVDEL